VALLLPTVGFCFGVGFVLWDRHNASCKVGQTLEDSSVRRFNQHFFDFPLRGKASRRSGHAGLS
jgi:hypothetical protein